MTRFLLFFAPLVLPCTPRLPDGTSVAADRAMVTLIPPRCQLYVELCGVQDRIRGGLQDPFVDGLLASAAGRAWMSSLDTPPPEALRMADEWLGAPALPLLADLFQRGLALGVDLSAEDTVLVAMGRDDATTSQGLATILEALERSAGWPGAFERPHERWSEAEVWRLADDWIVAHRASLVILGNDESLVRETLELAVDPDGTGMLGRERFEPLHAQRATPELWGWLDVDAIESRGDAGFRELREAHRSPSFLSLIGPGVAGLATSAAIAASLTLEDDGALLRLYGADSDSPACLAPGVRGGSMPAELPERQGLAEALVYRDVAGLFAHRMELFPAAAQPAFAEAITNGSLFFEGRDLCEDVLAHASPWIRVVVANPHFREGAVPELPLPGLVLVAVLEEDAEEPWVGAFQTVVSVINLEQVQKGKTGLRLHLERVGEVDLSVARYPTPGKEDGVDVRYNLEPAVAVVGRHLLLGTHASLVAGIAQDLTESQPLESARPIEWLSVDGRAMAAVIARNAEALISKKMLDEGLERERAAAEIEGLRLALESIAAAHLEIDGSHPGSPRVDLRVQLASPSESSR